jgi:hypothetical protein
MSALSSLVSQTWFIGLTVFFVGLAAGRWLDLLLGRRDRRRREDPVLAREILRFLDVSAIPALKYWYAGLSCRKNWKNNAKFPRDTIVTYICLIADLDMQAVRYGTSRHERTTSQ